MEMGHSLSIFFSFSNYTWLKMKSYTQKIDVINIKFRKYLGLCAFYQFILVIIKSIGTVYSTDVTVDLIFYFKIYNQFKNY